MDFNYFGEEGVPLVAIHGLGSAKTAWKPLQNELSKKYKFIIFDLPGHGESKEKASPEMTPEKLAELINNELVSNGINRFHLIGNSLGGWIALEMGAKFPNNVLSITGLAPAGLWIEPRSKISPSLSTSRYMSRIFYRYARNLLKIKFLKMIGFALVTPQWEKLSLEICVDAATAMGTATGYSDLWRGTHGNRFDKPISNEIPVSIIFGDSDYTLPAKDCQERSLAPQHCKWFLLERSGHAPMWDQTKSVLEIINMTTSGDVQTH